MGAFDREILLLGKEKFDKISNFNIAVFGVGGVGGFVVEALVRSGIKHITVFDGDVISESNLNRQIIATENNVGINKVDAIIERAKAINKDLSIKGEKVVYLPDNADNFDLSCFDYIVDAVDTVSAKIEIIKRAKQLNIPVISCMGTGGKLYPEKLKVDLIKNTNTCPLAKVVRKQLKEANIDDIKVVYSTEIGVKGERKEIPSMIFVPATAGLIIAREIILDICKND